MKNSDLKNFRKDAINLGFEVIKDNRNASANEELKIILEYELEAYFNAKVIYSRGILVSHSMEKIHPAHF